MSRWMLRIAGSVFAAIGTVWILQGVGILPGSFMTGQREWTVYGALALALGMVSWWLALRRPRR